MQKRATPPKMQVAGVPDEMYDRVLTLVREIFIAAEETGASAALLDYDSMTRTLAVSHDGGGRGDFGFLLPDAHAKGFYDPEDGRLAVGGELLDALRIVRRVAIRWNGEQHSFAHQGATSCVSRRAWSGSRKPGALR